MWSQNSNSKASIGALKKKKEKKKEEKDNQYKLKKTMAIVLV